MQVYLNGAMIPEDQAKIGFSEPGVLYGEGCFETLRVNAGEPRFFAEHWARFVAGAETLGLPLTATEPAVLEQIQQLAQANEITEGVARFSLHKTHAGADLVLFVTPPRRSPAPESFRIKFSDWPHPGANPLASVKHNNYARLRAAYFEASTDGWDDCLLCNAQQKVVEAATGSLFWVDENDRLATPPLSSGALPGIIRSLVMGLYPAIIEEAPGPDQLLQAKEIFLTNSINEIMPIRTLGTLELPCAGEITTKVMSAFHGAYPLK